jgi:phage tail sheath protein FI
VTCLGDSKFLPYAVNGFFENGGVRAFICRLVGNGATTAQAAFGDFTVRAAGPGIWGTRVFAKIQPSTTKKADGTSVGFRLQLAYWSGDTVPFDPFTPAGRLARPRPALTEDFDDLVVDEASPDFYGKRVPFIDLDKGETNQGPESSALGILVRNGGVAAGARPADGAQQLQGGADDATPLGVDDYKGDRAGNRTELQGLLALEGDPYRDVALVHAPYVSNDIVVEIVRHCEAMRFRFGRRRAKGADERVGHRPAHEHPHRHVVRGVLLPVDRDLGSAHRDTQADPSGGPCPRHLRAKRYGARCLQGAGQRGGAGRPRSRNRHQRPDAGRPQPEGRQRHSPVSRPRHSRLGARTLTSNALWKYVSVRRLFIFLERSIYEGTQWVVFEPNDDRLWARVVDTIRLFLRGQWRIGALFGRTEQEAFFITCDRTTMSQDDILNGRLICEIGIAPVRPAEFVVFRIFQNTAEAQR